MKTIMIIGGTDSSGGAGLTRDTAMAQSFGYEPMPIVTAVTAQSDEQFFAAQLIPPDMVAAQIRAAMGTRPPAAIKIGMLGSNENALAVADSIRALSCPVVIDPVLASSSGGALMSGLLPRRLLALASLITPNLPEAAALSGQPPAEGAAQIPAQAQWFLDQGAEAVLIKGGHATGQSATDVLFTGAQCHSLTAPRLEATLRGTGCALATAIGCALGDGQGLYSACLTAKERIYERLREVAKA